MKLKTIPVILVVLSVLCLGAVVLTALGVGLGLLLTVIIPALPMGHAIIAGTIAAVASAAMLMRAIESVSMQIPDDELSDGSVEILAREIIHPRSGGGGRKRPRK